jgi:hypothetical protein
MIRGARGVTGPALWAGVLAVLLLAGTWRVVMAQRLPVISRDGVTFCWYARDLGTQGWAYLRTPAAQQHPLLPALILGVERAARRLGAVETPLTWQRSGQCVCWSAGLAVVVLAGVLAGRLVRRLELPLDARLAMLLAMLLAALLDLNVWLSCDVMSEQVHLAFYLGAVCLLLELDNWRAAVGCGLLSGLAFLTREEGFVPALAGLFVLLTAWRSVPRRRTVAHAAALLAGFLLCAAPYWITVGRFSTKKNVSDLWAGEAAASAQPAPGEGCLPRATVDTGVEHGLTLGRLVTLDLPWYALLPQALYKLLRAGRVVVPLLALWPLYNLRRRLFQTPLLGWTACLAGHFTLGLLVLARKGYLDPRHMLVPTVLLIPLAALLLGRVVTWSAEFRRPWWGIVAVVVSVAPLAAYALRVPNYKDSFLADAAAWLIAHDPDRATKRLLAASSPRRVAFYTGLRWDVWDDQPMDYQVLCRQIRAPEPGYFAIQVGTAEKDAQFEFAGNRELLDRLMQDPEVAPGLVPIHVVPGPDQSELRLFELRPAPPAAPSVESQQGVPNNLGECARGLSEPAPRGAGRAPDLRPGFGFRAAANIQRYTHRSRI